MPLKKRQEVGQKHLKDPKAFSEYLKDIKSVFKSIEEYNPGKESPDSFWWYDCYDQ